MSTENRSGPEADADVAQESLIEHYGKALQLLRDQHESQQALKAFKKTLKGAGIDPASFIEFVTLRLGGKLTEKLNKAGALRRLAFRFGEEGVTPSDLFDDQMTDKARAALQHLDVAQLGYDAGLEGASTDSCPYNEGTDLADVWRRNHKAARAFMLRIGESTADQEAAQPRSRRSRAAADA